MTIELWIRLRNEFFTKCIFQRSQDLNHIWKNKPIPPHIWGFIFRTIERLFHKLRGLSTVFGHLSTVFSILFVFFPGKPPTSGAKSQPGTPVFKQFFNFVQEMIQAFQPVTKFNAHQSQGGHCGIPLGLVRGWQHG